MEMVQRKQQAKVTEAVRIFAVHEQTVCAWVQIGRLPARKIGHDWLIHVSELEKRRPG